MLTTVTRYHDISCGHRVVGHEGKCALLHGHNYRIHFTIAALVSLDSVGRVIDFGVIKNVLCEWLEQAWDHKFLAYRDDPVMAALYEGMVGAHGNIHGKDTLDRSIVWVPFNPTAENIGEYLLTVVGPELLAPHAVKLISVAIDETRKCSASVCGEI